MKGSLTRREQRFLDAYIETGDLANSAKRAGYRCPSTSAYSHRGRAILNGLQLTMPEVLQSEGVTDQLVAKTVFNGLKAKRKLFASFQGQFLDEREVDDHTVRAKFTEIAGRMKGVFIDRVKHEGADGGDIILQISPHVPQRGSTTKKELEFDE